MESTYSNYIRSIINIVKYLRVELDDQAIAINNEPYKYDLKIHENFRLFNFILKKCFKLYFNSFNKYFRIKIKVAPTIILEDLEVLSYLLPFDIVELSDLPAIAEIIGIILSIQKNTNKTDRDSLILYAESVDYLENCIDSLQRNIKNCMIDSIESFEPELRILAQIFFKLFIKNYNITDVNILNSGLKKTITLFIDSISLCNNVNYISTILNYGLEPFLKFKVQNKDEDIQSYLHHIWTTIKTIYNATHLDATQLNINYLVLSFLLSFDHESNSSFKLFEVINDLQFWDMLQSGLIQSDSLTRKRCLMILKRVFEICQSSKVLPSYDLCMTINILQSIKDVNNFTAWNDYFIILESLDEPQVHLLRPIYLKLQKLYRDAACLNFCIPMSWVLLLFQRAFNHCNKNVQHYSLALYLSQNSFNDESACTVVQFSISHLLLMLSNAFLFSNSDHQNNKTNIGILLPSFMMNLYNSCNEKRKKVFLKEMLNNIFDGRPWSSISLFYIIRSIPSNASTHSWTYDEINLAMNQYQINLSTHDQVVRSAVQCQLIKLILCHAGKNLSLLQLCSLLKHFNQDESWKRNTNVWNNIVNFYKSELENLQEQLKLFENFTSQTELPDSMDVSIACCIIIDVFAKIPIKENYYDIMRNMIHPFALNLKNCEVRPFFNNNKVIWTLELLFQLLEILSSSNSSCINEYEEYSELFILFGNTKILESLISLLVNIDYTEVNTTKISFCIIRLLNVLKICSKINAEYILNASSNHIIEYLNNKKNTCEVSSLKYILIFEFATLNFYENYDCGKKHILLEIAHNYLMTNSTPKAAKVSNKCSFKLIYNAISYISQKDPDKIDIQLVSYLPHLISTSSKDEVVVIFRFAYCLTNQIIQVNKFDSILSQLFKTAIDHRKGCSLFRTLISTIISILFHAEILDKTVYHTAVLEYTISLLNLTEDVLGVNFIVTQSFIDTLTQYPQIKGLFSPTFIEKVFLPLVLSGVTYQKQLKVTKETVHFIQDSNDDCSFSSENSEYESDKKARALAIKFLLSLKEKDSIDRLFALNIATAIEQCFRLNHNMQSILGVASTIQDVPQKPQKKMRDFPDSFRHRLKTRLLQLLLLIIPFLDETIFYEIPRLSQMACDEWISPEYIQNFQYGSMTILSPIKIFNPNSKLSEAEPPMWVKKAGGSLKPEESCDSSDAEIINIQQKVTPWRTMMNDLFISTRPELGSNITESEELNERKSNLIVVASLIDRLPNLGGLCRTCEIFGVESFCVPSLSVTKDPQFTALSLTAQQWVPMQEVKPSDIKDFLLRKREDGYFLIGVEQTTQSISIDQFKFPRKSIILLGNEREGIPCNLIQLMDSCIEIPQVGILRSLNVHVSGAIVVWEYLRQIRSKV